MIDSMAEKIALSIKKTNEENTASVAVMKFALIIFINTFSTIFFAMLIGLLTSKPLETVLALFAYALLRIFSGGYHFKSSAQCILVSAVTISVIPHVPLNSIWSSYLLISSFIIVSIFAPSNIKDVTRIPEKYYFVFKIISIIIVSSNFFINSYILTLAFFLQSITLLSRKGV
jgi:accessory gene regulator B